MSLVSIPERSLTGKFAKSVFYQDVNTIDIYIEDTAVGYEKLFLILFSRILKGEYFVEKVFPLGGRIDVVNLFETQKESLTRPSLFIIDGDLYLLSGDSVENQKGLYVLPFYCVENLLLEPHGLMTLLDEEEPIKLEDEVAAEFDYNSWLQINVPMLFDLFVEYAITFMIVPTEETVGYPVRKLVKDGRGNIDENKIRARIEYLKKVTVDAVGGDHYFEVRELVLNNFGACASSQIDTISGKDYLFPLLVSRFKAIIKSRIPNINIKLRLARYCEIGKINEVQSYILTKQ